MTSQNIIHLSCWNDIYLLAKRYIKNKFIHISSKKKEKKDEYPYNNTSKTLPLGYSFL